MRETVHPDVDARRSITGKYRSGYGERQGRFFLERDGVELLVIASDGSDWAENGFPPPAWEHVSVSVAGQKRCPTWAEMCWVRALFFAPDEWVVQFHPPAAENVNVHEFCLHLWRPVGVDLPLPPKACV